MSPLASLIASEARRPRTTIPPPSSGIFASRSLAAAAAELFLPPLAIAENDEAEGSPTDIDDLLSGMHTNIHDAPTVRP